MQQESRHFFSASSSRLHFALTRGDSAGTSKTCRIDRTFHEVEDVSHPKKEWFACIGFDATTKIDVSQCYIAALLARLLFSGTAVRGNSHSERASFSDSV